MKKFWKCTVVIDWLHNIVNVLNVIVNCPLDVVKMVNICYVYFTTHTHTHTHKLGRGDQKSYFGHVEFEVLRAIWIKIQTQGSDHGL